MMVDRWSKMILGGWERVGADSFRRASGWLFDMCIEMGIF